jgi:glycosyltransferase involved in cell wall biosynthesis
LLSPLGFRLFDFSSFDLIISSATGAYFPNALNKKNARLFCYCHTPPRYLYGLPTARNLKKYPLFNALAQFVNHFLRYFDYRFAQNVDQFIANSSTTAARIKKFYRRDSIIINPPVELPVPSSKKMKENFSKTKMAQAVFSSAQPQREKHWCEHCEKIDKPIYYLTGGRLARAKRYDIPILACKKLDLPLKIFGRDFAGYQNELRSLSGPNTEFLGEITNQQKQQLLASATAFIFASDNEDFGIAPVEAMAAGTPVIAYRSGGVTETVIDGKTGLFFDELTPDSCAKAIQKLSTLKINPQDCLTQAQKFSPQSFTQKIKKLIQV